MLAGDRSVPLERRFNVGDKLRVEILEIDHYGRVRLKAA
jgi:ribosomal protein S1